MVEDRRRVGSRVTVLQSGIAVVFVVLAIGFWVLQILQNAKYEELAQNNHQRTIALRAPRGVVFDRNGEVLVENRKSYSISIVREQTRDLSRTVRLLAAALQVDEAQIREIVDSKKREPSYRPIVIVQNASYEQVAAVRVRKYELPDVEVEQIPTRSYHDTMAAHLYGYVGEADEAQIAQDPTLKSGDIIGKQGIEKIYNAMLMGEDGARRVRVNSVGREMESLGEQAPVDGHRLRLTIDADVQRAIEDGFKALGFNGAAIALDPNNGEVLAFTSLPAYDPNVFATGIDRTAWAALNNDRLRPLNDRALQGKYSPGSTFKMTVAAAGLEEGLITPDFRVHCSGAGVFYGRAFKCHKRGGHGTVDLRTAIAQSCNVYFYTVGNMVGIDRLHKWATNLGLGVKSGIDLPNEAEGIMPSTEWKRRRTGEKWYAGETISVSIGQGYVSVTPISMAVMIATLANGGTRVTPHLLKAVDEGDGKGWKERPAPQPKSITPMKPQNIQAIRDGLWMVVNAGGTGGRAKIPGYDVSGKTGTAQVISLEGGRAAAGRTDRDLRDHGWFVFFAPRDNPQIAGVIFAEHGEHGYSAAPIAKYAIETFFAKKEGRPLPPPLKPVNPPEPLPDAVRAEGQVATAGPAGQAGQAGQAGPAGN
jgi:penicillin-binding protein 2